MPPLSQLNKGRKNARKTRKLMNGDTFEQSNRHTERDGYQNQTDTYTHAKQTNHTHTSTNK